MLRVKRKMTCNARKGPIDPSRTVTLRRMHIADLRRRFAALKLRVRKFIVDEDAMALNQYNPDQERDEHGRWIGAGHAAVDAYHAVESMASAQFDKLPGPVKSAVKAAVHVAFTGWRATQALAERISQEKGSTPEQAAKLRSVLAAADIAAFKPVAIATAPLGGAVAAASWIVPPITGVYLLHSTVRHPLATYRAAKGLVSEFLGRHTDVLNVENFDASEALYDALNRHQFDDWYTALLHASLERVQDVSKSVRLADLVYAANGMDISDPADDDMDVLFGEVRNVFCATGEGGGVDPSCSPSGRTTSGGDALNNHEIAAQASADVTSSKFGIPKKDIQFHRLDAERTYGEHGGDTSHLVNVHTGNPINKQINFKLDRTVTEGEHLAAHETVHRAYSANEEAGREAMESLKNVKAEYGSAVSLYGAFNGAHENLIELGATYSHSPDALKRYSPEMYKIAHKWATTLKGKSTTNARDYEFHSDPEKVKAFQKWLKAHIEGYITSAQEEELWRRYAEAGYKKGAGRAFDDVRVAHRVATTPQALSYAKGSREEFLRSSFGQAESVDKIKLLAGRSFDDLKNVTSDMSTRMSRTLTDGLVQGQNPRQIAKQLADDVDIGQERALIIARTEIIRAHAEGQLDAFDKLGVQQIGVQVEWSTAGDDRVCEECSSFEGDVYDVDDAHGLIPAHPQCRCAFIPVVPEDLQG